MYDTSDETGGSGRLAHLRTTAEMQTGLTLINAFIVEVPQRQVNDVIKHLDRIVPERDAINIQHLRRVARPEFLPLHVQQGSGSTIPERTNRTARSTCYLFNSNSCLTERETGKAQPPQLGEPTKQPQTLYVLLCPAGPITLDDLTNTLLSVAHLWEGMRGPCCRMIPVPADPPATEEEAKQLSLLYWPVVYKKHNPKGPHPSMISRGEAELSPFAEKWMKLARQAGVQAALASIGEPIGAVIIDPSRPSGPVVVVVAGDARWSRNCAVPKTTQGNVMAHAAMRAIGMIARRRRSGLSQENILSIESNRFSDAPLTALERQITSQTTWNSRGYLCTGLDVFLTHEPCVMCSMAILHSRFGRVIFGERMQQTGGLVAETGNKSEPGLGYGLFWRPDLNWKMLAWQWLDNAGLCSLSLNSVSSRLHA